MYTNRLIQAYAAYLLGYFLFQKPLRVERQKGKAALGKLRVIEDLPKERCCVDNCVMVSCEIKRKKDPTKAESSCRNTQIILRSI